MDHDRGGRSLVKGTSGAAHIAADMDRKGRRFEHRSEQSRQARIVLDQQNPLTFCVDVSAEHIEPRPARTYGAVANFVVETYIDEGMSQFQAVTFLQTKANGQLNPNSVQIVPI